MTPFAPFEYTPTHALWLQEVLFPVTRQLYSAPPFSVNVTATPQAGPSNWLLLPELLISNVRLAPVIVQPSTRAFSLSRIMMRLFVAVYLMIV